jgi:Transglutaminase-like superfamily
MEPKEREYFNVTVNVTGTDGFATISRGAFAQGTDPKTMRIVSSGIDPLVIAPPELEPYLAPTLDAQSNNSEISELSAGMGDDPQAIFAYVRDKIEYDPYYGSMRGALGTYLGASGSSENQTNLLVAMLRAAHIPARYVVGELDDETALTIINGMFKYPSVKGYDRRKTMKKSYIIIFISIGFILLGIYYLIGFGTLIKAVGISLAILILLFLDFILTAIIGFVATIRKRRKS